MIKYWLGYAIAFVCLSALWLAGIERQVGQGTASSRWVFDAYQHKTAIANKVTGPRVLIVAGSNALFGIDSARLSAYWKRPTINLAVNAGLGLPYILDVSKQVAKRGDIILLPLEYALYLDDGVANSQIIDYVLARDPQYWHTMALSKKLAFAAAMSPERWIEGLRVLPDPPVTNGTYGAHHLDLNGDQTHSSSSERQQGDIAAVTLASSAEKAWKYGARALQEKGGWHLISAYALWARQAGVCVIAVPTVLLHQSSYDLDPIERQFYEKLPSRVKALGIPYAGNPLDFMYPAEWFFDTDHHLQDWARIRHTDKLIGVLHQDPYSYCAPASTVRVNVVGNSVNDIQQPTR